MDKLGALRELMTSKGIDAYVVTSADDHQSEYVTEYWRTRAWLSGFSGSNGLLAVTRNEAALWTDGRYFLQAEKQLSGSGIVLMKMEEPGVPKYTEWLAEKLPEGGTLGFDGRTVSVDECGKIEKAVKHKHVKLYYEEDLAGAVWAGRPSQFSDVPAFSHDVKFSGKTTKEKLADVRAKMREKNANAYLIAALDSVAWLFNIRGWDIPQTPVVYSYALVTETEAFLFIAPEKMKNIDASADYTRKDYGEVFEHIASLNACTVLLYDPRTVNIKLFNAIPSSCVRGPDEADIISALKAVKNPIEIKNVRGAHIKEGVVMIRFLKWIRETKEAFTETDIHEKLTALRKEQDGYLQPSFDTIAGYMSNGAIVHYRPEPGECAEVKREGLLLVDTGGQYLDGTTDITRTIVMGGITEEMKRDFTLVLKGHIALASALFLKGTTGGALDILARTPLWLAGKNFRHGTGHGLGFCLGVHEGPQNISMRPNATKLEAGMLISNEPGFYKEGSYGIRIENILLAEERFTNDYGTFMGFETVSLCPIDLRAVDMEMLTEEEKDWLKDYHDTVLAALSPHLSEDEVEWLKKELG